MASFRAAAHRFHDGERTVQKRAGVAPMAERVARGIQSEMPPRAQAFLAAQPFAVVATGAAPGPVWISLLTGAPGFLRASDPRTIEIDAAAHTWDPLVTELTGGASIGVLAIDLGTRRRLRANGTVERGARPIRVRIGECFANCPKYIQRRTVRPVVDDPATPVPIRRATTLSQSQRERVALADTFFIGSRHTDAGLDASHRGGSPGFVQVPEPGHLVWPDYPGNAMFQTLGNLTTDPHAGLLFVDFVSGDLLYLTGRATVDFDRRRAAGYAGAERIVDFEIDMVLEAPAGIALRASLVDFSPFNP